MSKNVCAFIISSQMHHFSTDTYTQTQRIMNVSPKVRSLHLHLQLNISSSNGDELMTIEQVDKLEQEMKELELEMKQEVELIRALEDQKLDLLVELADIEKRRKNYAHDAVRSPESL